MTQLWGHDDARRQVADPNVSPVLLAGPSGVGKYQVALAAAHHHAAPVDVATYRPVRMADVRDLTAWLRTGALAGTTKAAALDLDGSTPAVGQALLKLLEEPPAGTYLVLSASGQVSAPLASRVTVVRCTPLSDADVGHVLASLGVFGQDVQRLTALANGSPGYALGFRAAIQARAKVLQLLHGVQRRDWVLTTRMLATKWEQPHAQALQLWLADVLAGTTNAYAPGEKLGLDVLIPRERMVDATGALALPVPPGLAIAMAVRRILA